MKIILDMIIDENIEIINILKEIWIDVSHLKSQENITKQDINKHVFFLIRINL